MVTVMTIILLLSYPLSTPAVILVLLLLSLFPLQILLYTITIITTAVLQYLVCAPVNILPCTLCHVMSLACPCSCTYRTQIVLTTSEIGDF